MRTSVVIATYNGALFIEEQLQSILEQTKAVDEVLLADDGSTDNTVELVQSFIVRHSLQSWKIKTNSVNKGWKRNFIELFFAAEGDIIFYCDQDDRWLPQKVELMQDILFKQNEILCLASRYRPIDEHGKGLSVTVDEKADGTMAVQRIPVNDKRFYHVPSGCTLAFRRPLLNYMDPSFTECGPDRILCRTAALLDGLYDFDCTVMEHRFHQNNVSNDIRKVENLHGSASLPLRRQYIQEDVDSLDHCLQVNERQGIEACVVERIEKIRAFEYERVRLLESGSLYSLVRALKRCTCFAAFPMVLMDFAYAAGINRVLGRCYDRYKRFFS